MEKDGSPGAVGLTVSDTLVLPRVSGKSLGNRTSTSLHGPGFGWCQRRLYFLFQTLQREFWKQNFPYDFFKFPSPDPRFDPVYHATTTSQGPSSPQGPTRKVFDTHFYPRPTRYRSNHIPDTTV